MHYFNVSSQQFFRLKLKSEDEMCERVCFLRTRRDFWLGGVQNLFHTLESAGLQMALHNGLAAPARTSCPLCAAATRTAQSWNSRFPLSHISSPYKAAERCAIPSETLRSRGYCRDSRRKLLTKKPLSVIELHSGETRHIASLFNFLCLRYILLRPFILSKLFKSLTIVMTLLNMYPLDYDEGKVSD